MSIGLVGASGRAIDLHVLQYGVTRERLQDFLDQSEGWDIVHFSGHGEPGSLILEKPDGSADPMSSADLADMLRQAGARLKLVMLSSCLSAAARIDQTLTWLGLTPEQAPRRDTAAVAGASATSATVARAVTEALDCAVVAMRYAVEDEFATKLSSKLYEYLLDKGQPLPQAIRRAIASVNETGAAFGALSVAAPALFAM